MSTYTTIICRKGEQLQVDIRPLPTEGTYRFSIHRLGESVDWVLSWAELGQLVDSIGAAFYDADRERTNLNQLELTEAGFRALEEAAAEAGF